MSDRRLLVETAEEVFAAACHPHQVIAAERTWLPDLWTTLVQLGFPLLGVDEACGGAGGSLADLAAVARVAGAFAAPIPLVETALANVLLAEAGLPVLEGPLAVAALTAKDPQRVRRVPWAHLATRVVVVDSADRAFCIPAGSLSIDAGWNLAGESRDDVLVENGMLSATDGRPVDMARHRFRDALLRSALMAGALDRILVLTGEYIRHREQFGTSLASFQAVQQQFAELAGVVAGAGLAVDAAAESPAPLAVAAARTYVGSAVAVATHIAHQLHGAIGFTYEHELHLHTRRLWAWRDEGGGTSLWASEAGRRARDEGVWPAVTA